MNAGKPPDHSADSNIAAGSFVLGTGTRVIFIRIVIAGGCTIISFDKYPLLFV